MVAAGLSSEPPLVARLIDGLSAVPNDWALTPVQKNKRPYRDNWQTEKPISHKFLIKEIKTGIAKGYGLRTGEISNGLLAIDADGKAAEKLLQELANGNLAPTVTFTSGKVGRCQRLYRVPKEYWEVVTTTKRNTGVKGDDGKDQLLEFRWNGCQSVLPPSVHPETGEYKWVASPQECAVAECPLWVIELMLNQQHQQEIYRDTKQTARWSEIDWALSYLASIPPYMADDYHDWVKVGMALKAVDESLLANWVEWSRQSAKYKPGDCEKKWKSFKNSGVGIATLGYWAKQNGWSNPFKSSERSSTTHQQLINNHQQPSTKVVPHPTAKRETLGKEQLLKEVDNLIQQDLPRSELEAIIPELATKANRSSRDIWSLYRARLKEAEELEERTEVKRKLPNLFECQRSRLNPHDLFWGDNGRLAELLNDVAQAMPTAVEHLITAFIPVSASRIGTSSRVAINPKSRYIQSPIFWTCNVAPSGSKKTPTQQVVIEPLDQMEASEYRNWKQQYDDYKLDLSRYKNKKKGSDSSEPEPPPPRKRFIIQNSTIEARIRIHSENPRGVLYYRDEWAGFVSGRNKYRGGKGDDSELELSEFNGKSLSKDTVKEEGNVYLPKSAICRVGSTQTKTLQKVMADHEDISGEFARWLWCVVGCPPAFIDLFADDDTSGEELTAYLGRIYQGLGELPTQDYFLSTGAKALFQAYQHQLISWTLEETHSGMQTAYPKFETYLGRFALWLHLINAVLAGDCHPSQIIEPRTMEVACLLTDFYIAQLKVIYALNSPQMELTGNLLKIKELVERKPGVQLREIKSGIFALRKIPSDRVRKDCQVLVDAGVIHLKEKGYYPIGNVDVVDEMLMHHQQPSTASKPDSTVISKKRSRKNVDVVDEMLMPHQQPQTRSHQAHQADVEKNVDVVDVIADDFGEPQPHPIPVDVQNQKMQIININTSTAVSQTTTPQDVDVVDALVDEHQQTINNHQQSSTTQNTKEETGRGETPLATAPLTPPAPTSPSPNDQDAVMGNAELIRECITEMDWEMISVLTEQWTEEFKKAVWALLTAPERAAVKALSPKYSIVKSGEALNKGDYVEVLVGKCKGKRALVSSMDEGGVWLKELKGALLIDGCPYQPHQLKRTTAD